MDCTTATPEKLLEAVNYQQNLEGQISFKIMYLTVIKFSLGIYLQDHIFISSNLLSDWQYGKPHGTLHPRYSNEDSC